MVGIIFLQLGEVTKISNSWFVIFVRFLQRIGIIFSQLGEVATNING